jgi:hypothetical protein
VSLCGVVGVVKRDWCGWGGCQLFDLRYLNPIGSAWLGRFFRAVVELGSVWICWSIPFSFFLSGAANCIQLLADFIGLTPVGV